MLLVVRSDAEKAYVKALINRCKLMRPFPLPCPQLIRVQLRRHIPSTKFLTSQNIHPGQELLEK